MDDAAGLVVLVQHRQGVQVGLAAEGFEHGGGRGVAGHGGLIVEQGAEVAAVVAQHHGAAVAPGHQGAGIARWMLLGTAEEIALDQVDAHFGQYRQFLRQLDAFGDHLGPGGFGDLQD
ncbi:hypothetical protein D3C73_1342350 [compost metagenome]